jgi:hypothetical protein
MAITHYTPSLDTAGGELANGEFLTDSGLNATVVRDAFTKNKLRMVLGDNTAVAGAAYLQLHNSVNPVLGTDFAACCLPLQASKMIVAMVQGTEATEFSAGISYALTDTARGSTLTGADRALCAAAE